MWYGFCQFWARLVFLLLFGIRAFGVRNVPRRGPVILASNHQSYLDPVIVALPLSRRVAIMAREGLFSNGLFGRLIRSLGAFPVKRATADLRAMREALGRLRSGEQLLLFPEGMRTSDGRINELQPGLAVLAQRSGAVVVPVVIDGAYECWPRHRKLFRPGSIRVAYGRAMNYEGGTADEAREFARELHRRMVTMREDLRAMRVGR